MDITKLEHKNNYSELIWVINTKFEGIVWWLLLENEFSPLCPCYLSLYSLFLCNWLLNFCILFYSMSSSHLSHLLSSRIDFSFYFSICLIDFYLFLKGWPSWSATQNLLKIQSCWIGAEHERPCSARRFESDTTHFVWNRLSMLPETSSIRFPKLANFTKKWAALHIQRSILLTWLGE